MSLQDEIANLSTTLAISIGRLQEIGRNAQAFEEEIRAQVTQAEAARALMKLSSEETAKIAALLGSESDQRVRTEIDKLAREHNRQIDLLRDSNRRIAGWTFFGGVILGTIANVAVALLIPH